MARQVPGHHAAVEGDDVAQAEVDQRAGDEQAACAGARAQDDGVAFGGHVERVRHRLEAGQRDRARDAGLSVSVFLRDMGLKDSPEKRKTLPPEVLAFIGVLSGIIGALEIIARKRLDNEDLDGLERAELKFRAKEVKMVIKDIKFYLSCSEKSALEGQPDKP